PPLCSIYPPPLHDALPISHRPDGGRREGGAAHHGLVPGLPPRSRPALAPSGPRRRDGLEAARGDRSPTARTALDERKPRGNANEDRKSTRLNSSQSQISYA